MAEVVKVTPPLTVAINDIDLDIFNASAMPIIAGFT